MSCTHPADEVAEYREELRRSRRAGVAGAAISLVLIGVMYLTDLKTFFALLPLSLLGMIPAMRMVLRPRPLRRDPAVAAVKRVLDGTTLRAVEGVPVEQARLALLDELDALQGPPDAPPWSRWLSRLGAIPAAVGTLGWATAGVVTAVRGAPAAELGPFVFGVALFGTGWWFIERERQREREASRILRERLDALDTGGVG